MQVVCGGLCQSCGVAGGASCCFVCCEMWIIMPFLAVDFCVHLNPLNPLGQEGFWARNSLWWSTSYSCVVSEYDDLDNVPLIVWWAATQVTEKRSCRLKKKDFTDVSHQCIMLHLWWQRNRHRRNGKWRWCWCSWFFLFLVVSFCYSMCTPTCPTYCLLCTQSLAWCCFCCCLAKDASIYYKHMSAGESEKLLTFELCFCPIVPESLSQSLFNPRMLLSLNKYICMKEAG